MSQISKPGSGGGGGSSIQTINGDTGSITGSAVTIFSSQSTKNSGGSVAFVNSGTTSTLNFSDSRGSTYLGNGAGGIAGAGVGGNSNTSVGFDSLSSTTDTGNANCAYGSDSLNALSTGDLNSSYGTGSGQLLVSGSGNSIFGYVAGQAYVGSESNNILIGSRVLGTAGESGVIRIGDSTTLTPQTTCFIAGISGVMTSSSQMVTINTTTGQLGSAVIPAGTVTALNGNSGSATASGGAITVDTANTTVKFVGSGSTLVQDFGLANLILGNSATAITSASDNMGLGDNIFTLLSSGQKNCALGSSALRDVSGGSSNVGIGFAALANHTTTSDNIAIGDTALANSLTLSQTIAIGTLALASLTAGVSLCTAVGYRAGAGSTGTSNTIMGYDVLGGAGGAGASSQNSLVGDRAGQLISSASSNSGLGYICLANLLTGSSNVAIGASAGSSYASSESSNIVISNVGTAAESNVIRIGTQGAGAGQQNLCFIAGITGVTVVGAAVLCDGTGKLGTVVSSERYKENIVDMDDSVSVLNLRPVEFAYKADSMKTKQYGLIAEEVENDFQYLCLYDKEGRPDSVKYHELPVFLLREIQRLNARIEVLEKKSA